MKRGLILTNAYSNYGSVEHQTARLCEELEALGVHMDVRRNNFYGCSIEDSDVSCRIDADFVIFLDKDKYMSAMLEKAGVRVFDCHHAIMDADDKMTTYIRLAGSGLPLVDTMAGLLCYSEDASVASSSVDAVENAFGYPVIVKECYGSMGTGVYKCDTRAELVSVMDRVKTKPHLFERYVSTGQGMDIRVIVIGGEVVSCMLRHSDGDYRSNLALGGHGTRVETNSEIERIARGVASVMHLDYAGIDLLLGDEATAEYYERVERGQEATLREPNYLICEVNSNAFFKGSEEVTGVNVARAYAEHIYYSMYSESDIATLISSANRVSVTLVGLERCRAVLGDISREALVQDCRAMILDEQSHIYRAGDTFYVDNGVMQYAVDATTYMVKSVKKIR